jgi:2-phosphosulfolactate phosphatase
MPSKSSAPVKHIKAEVHFSPAHLDEIALKDKNLIVVDVLRSSTTIITALANGAKEIIPVSDIESAVKISGSLFGDVTLRAGERNGRMIEGFNLGNSPQEYAEQTVKGKSIIFMTTNGTTAIAKARYAKHLVIAGFANLTTVVEFLTGLNEDFVILCAGKENRFCLEDVICAGRILTCLEGELNETLTLDDGAIAAMALEKAFGKNILRMLKGCSHGKFLTDIGFADDLRLCAQVDALPILPVLSGSVIRLRPAVGQNPPKTRT